MNILFLTHPYPNYVPDLLLHGLRKLLGSQVVDYPRKECLYHQAQGGVWPELYYEADWFPKENGGIDREDIETRLKCGYFDYLICDIRAISLLETICKKIGNIQIRLIFIDGEDSPVKIRPGSYVICRRETDGSDFSIPLPMALPEEIFQRITSCSTSTKLYSIGFIGSIGKQSEKRRNLIEKLTSYYPDGLFRTFPTSFNKARHPEGRMGLDQYYAKLQKCKITLTLAGAGYDTFRFWENAACNAAHVSERIPLFIPNNFKDGKDIMRFSDIDELRRIIDYLLSNEQRIAQMIQDSRKHLLDFHLTTKRAIYFLDMVRLAFSS